MGDFVPVRSRGRGRGRGGAGGGRNTDNQSTSSGQVIYYGNQPQAQQSGSAPSSSASSGRGRGVGGGPMASTNDSRMPAAERHRKLVPQKLRPLGTSGTVIPLIGNFFKMAHSDVTVFHYDVAFTKVKKERAGGGGKAGTGEKKRMHTLAPPRSMVPPPNVDPPEVLPEVKGKKKKSKKQKEAEETGVLAPIEELVIIEDPEEALREEEEMATSFDRFLKKFSFMIVDQLVADHPTVFTGNTRHVYDGFKNLYTAKLLTFPTPPKKDEFEVKETPPAEESVESEGKKAKKKKPKKACYTAKVAITLDGRVSEFMVEIKLVERIFLEEALAFYRGAQEAAISERVISVFEIIFGFIFAQSFTAYQRKFFDFRQVEKSENARVRRCDFVQGFVNSVRMTEFGLALNVHLKTTVTISKSYAKLDHLFGELVNAGPSQLETINSFDAGHLRSVNHILHHLKIYTLHGKQSAGSKTKLSYTVDIVIDKRPKTYFFPGRDGKPLSIHEYFVTEYGLKLKNYPLVKTTGKKARFIPLELCFLVDKQFLSNSKIDNEIQKELLLKSTHAPNRYFNRLSGIVQHVSGLDTVLQRQFGLGVGSLKPASFSGRVLPAPRQLSGQRRDPFVQAKEASNWAAVCFDEPRQRPGRVRVENLTAFIREMKGEAESFKMKFAEPRSVKIIRIDDLKYVEEEMKGLMSGLRGVELLLIGIPSRHSNIRNTTDLYQKVKHYCDQVYGVISQCFKADHLGRIPRGYFDNLLLKINGKIGGQNNVLDVSAYRSLLPALSQLTMIVGIDVNHPGETEKMYSSVSAAVGSYDAQFSKYTASIRVQKKERDELVKQLDEMILELLTEFARFNSKRYPENLIIFRDGVSEGQFEKVKSTEIPLIKAAINKTNKAMKLTVIVVQKRHHTRFVRAEPLLPKLPPGRQGLAPKPVYNVPSGTVVDECIVEPIYSMFYLNSHFSQLGTSKPTKYIILRDDLNFSADNIQKFCFYACHTCIRSRLVSSIPIPVRYADLCAYRSKAHIEAQAPFGLDAKGDFDSLSEEERLEREEEIIARLNESVKIKSSIRNQLYYC